MTPAQCRMARAAIEIGVRELADAAQVSTNTVTRFERGEPLKDRTISAIRAALAAAGVIFVEENGEGPGVRLSKRTTTLRGEIAELRGRVERAKIQAPAEVVREVDLIAVRDRFSGLETEEALIRILENLGERARILAAKCPELKQTFPDIG